MDFSVRRSQFLIQFLQYLCVKFKMCLVEFCRLARVDPPAAPPPLSPGEETHPPPIPTRLSPASVSSPPRPDTQRSFSKSLNTPLDDHTQLRSPHLHGLGQRERFHWHVGGVFRLFSLTLLLFLFLDKRYK